ncbi:Hypothetical predicted protein [Olea europaea subsp. europaea]|uniref:Uncharacterized protein n=1 Tax=Olea europaea subsp. europaea TaxID=158383 RepID=A0A8S0VFS6_OLEEU|nr:Hypothetical predicted protein [Olea europaea subsp. europaea]
MSQAIVIISVASNELRWKKILMDLENVVLEMLVIVGKRKEVWTRSGGASVVLQRCKIASIRVICSATRRRCMQNSTSWRRPPHLAM